MYRHGFVQGDLANLQTYLRYLQREEIFSEETAFVTKSDGTKINTLHYALSFIRRYRDDPGWLRMRFGEGMDFEALQQEMIVTAWYAAKNFERRDRTHREQQPTDFIQYLSYCLITRIVALTDQHRGSVIVKSIEAILSIEEASAPIISRDADRVRDALTVPDVAEILEDILDLPHFLKRLTPLQAAIFNYRAEHTWGDGSLGEFLETQGISYKMMMRELDYMQRAYKAFREENPDWEQLMMVRTYKRKKRQVNTAYTTKKRGVV